VPLLMCSLSVLFSYKVGLFNIGAAGQYVAGIGVGLFFAHGLNAPWWICMIMAMLAGAALGAISGLLKATRNVNEVISGIMLNWICLYLVNMLLAPYMDIKMNETFALKVTHPAAVIPESPLFGSLLNGHKYTTIAVELAILIAVGIWILMTKTKLGYELRATGLNKYAARYSGMRDGFNIILTMAISGGLAGLGASMFYLTDMIKWPMAVTSVPAMGFNGIAAAFLGGLHPLGAIFSSFFIQHITDGGSFMEKIYPSEIAGFISAIIIYMCAFVLLIKQQLGRAGMRRAAEKKGGEAK
jgi:simple sugar transport system permease protein